MAEEIRARRRGTPMPERILDAFETLLADCGTRAATLDAVAKRVGLTRQGLLHHFPSRARLIDALIERLRALVEADAAAMAAHPAGAAEYYILSSTQLDLPSERAVNAVTRLAQGGSAEARDALRDCRARWFEVLVDAEQDEVIARLVMFAGDGMSYNVDMSDDLNEDPFLRPQSLREVLELLETLPRRRAR